MYSVTEEIRIEKLKENYRKLKYLKLLTQICLMIDIVSYIVFELVHFIYNNSNEESISLAFFILRVNLLDIKD